MATEFHRAHSLSCLNDLFVFSCRAHCGHGCYEPSFWNQMQRCWYGISSSSSEGDIVFKILVMFLHFNMHLILSFASSLLQRPLAIALCIYFNVRNRLQIDMANAILIARLILRCFDELNTVSCENFAVQNRESWPRVTRINSHFPSQMKLMSCNAHWRINKVANCWVLGSIRLQEQLSTPCTRPPQERSLSLANLRSNWWTVRSYVDDG